ncbi:MAG: polysaccharide deacetylase family protein [Pseudomonadota bacterium]
MIKNSSDWQTRLETELDEWNYLGEHAAMWWRDDDAIEATDELTDFYQLCDRYDIPVSLVVVPNGLQDSLVQWVNDINADDHKVDILIHGFAHINHASEGEKKQELGDHRDLQVVLIELQQSVEIMRTRLGRWTLPVLVPPWNRISDAVVRNLLSVGIGGLSTFNAREQDVLDVQNDRQLWQVNTHVDVIDWKRDRSFIGMDRVVDQLVAHLAAKREGRADIAEPTGLLTHHLVHQAETKDALQILCALLDEHPAVKWLSAKDVFQLRSLGEISDLESQDPEQNAYDPMGFDINQLS